MSLLFETIKIENRLPVNIYFHNERLNKSRKELFGINNFMDIKKAIDVPDNLGNGIYKCKLVYSRGINRVEFIEYKMREINKLIAVTDNEIEYKYKYLNRSALKKLLEKHISSFNEEILIIKNGFITDTSFSNIIFFDGTKWFTPANPLLRGTQREKLLSDKFLVESEIKLSDLRFFKQFKLINAMIDIDTAPHLLIDNIIF